MSATHYWDVRRRRVVLDVVLSRRRRGHSASICHRARARTVLCEYRDNRRARPLRWFHIGGERIATLGAAQARGRAVVNARHTTAAVIFTVTIAGAVLPPLIGATDLPTAQHHLAHSALIAGAVVAGVLVAAPSRDTRAGHYGWLLAATFAPVAAMLLMWPSEYTWFELHAAGHVIEHLGLVGLGFVTGYTGQRYAAGIGWASGLSLFAMAFVSAWGFGVAPADAIAASVP